MSLSKFVFFEFLRDFLQQIYLPLDSNFFSTVQLFLIEQFKYLLQFVDRKIWKL